MSAHARLSPSGAKIWMTCPAAPGMQAKIEDRTSVYAEEGTNAHTLAEYCLRENIQAAATVKAPIINLEPGAINRHFEITEEMAAAVQVYLDYVRANIEEGDEHALEEKLTLNDHIWGTADFIRYRPKTRHLLVADYKHGAGVFVGVEENPQALTYAVMAAKKLGNRGVDKVTLAIIQPRCDYSGEGGVREWEFSAVDLIEWEADLISAMEATLADTPAYVPGPHCRWCRAAAICPALARQAQETARQEFAPALPYEPAQLAKTLHALPSVEAWIKAVRAFAFNEAQQGRCPPGWKLAQKRPTRGWANEEQTEEFLKTYGLDDKDIYKRSLKSPAQIEAVIGKKNKDIIQDLIVAESSGTTLVPDSDSRPMVATDAKSDFAD